MFLDSFIFVIHILVLLFAVFGFLLPKKYLILHLLMWPAILIHWLTNDDKCVLTELEKNTQSDDEEYVHFSLKIHKILGLKRGKTEDDDKNTMVNIYTICYSITWLISLYRYVYV